MKRRILAAVASLIVLVGALLGVSFGERLLYLVGAARFQGELLWGRIPIEQAVLDEPRASRLKLVPEIKRFGEQVGLSATANYSTINPTWDRTIWNVSASEPLAFRNKRWWFPIVGSVPYLGFFEREAADGFALALEAEGLDVYVRTAGAYSTLGWFEDPLTPNMLDWNEERLANTILHELAHATVWIPGSVQFNESFANFVGDRAADRYMRTKYGEGSEQVVEMEHYAEDIERWRDLMHQLYKDLDFVYRSDLEADAKLKAKRDLYRSIEDRVRAAGFHETDRWVLVARRGPWNNARMMQFRTYNRSTEWFEALYEQQDRDLLRFMHEVERVTTGADSPYRALARSVGADPDASQ